MRFLWIHVVVLSISQAFLLKRQILHLPTSLFVRPEDFAAGRIQPALPFRGTPEEEEKRRQAEALKAEAEAIEKRKADRLKAARRDAEEEFYETKYTEKYQQNKEAAIREAREAQLKLENEQALLEEERRRQLQENERIQRAYDAKEEAERKRKILLSDLEESRQRKEGARRDQRKSKDAEKIIDENISSMKEKEVESTDRAEAVSTQETVTHESGSELATSTTTESESIRATTIPSATSSSSRVVKSNLPLFFLPATAILGGLLALRNREQAQKEVEKQLQMNMVQRTNQLLGKKSNKKSTEKEFQSALLRKKKEINDYGNLALALFGVSIIAELGIVAMKGSATM